MTYTPTTEQVRAEYVSQGWAPDGSLYGENDSAEFDRWYAEAIRKAKAEAWEEGITASGINLDWQLHLLDHNPYRGQERKPDNTL